VVGQPDDAARLQGADRGIADRLAGAFMDNLEHVWQELPQGIRERPIGQRFGHRVHEGNAPVGVRGNHPIADAGQRRAQPFRMLSQFFFGATTRDEDALSILQRSCAKPTVLVGVGVRHYRPSISLLARLVPTTRARIFANAVSRVVVVSSQNGENPQSSHVPSCPIGI
jgi:hypothetical protein